MGQQSGAGGGLQNTGRPAGMDGQNGMGGTINGRAGNDGPGFGGMDLSSLFGQFQQFLGSQGYGGGQQQPQQPDMTQGMMGSIGQGNATGTQLTKMLNEQQGGQQMQEQAPWMLGQRSGWDVRGVGQQPGAGGFDSTQAGGSPNYQAYLSRRSPGYQPSDMASMPAGGMGGGSKK